MSTERGLGGWHVEWLTVPLVFMTAAAPVQAVATCVESLEVDAVAMQRNLGDVTTADSTAAADLVDRILAHHGEGE